jgi:16S rRNA (cytidine1402-2'-O)-methyltransferase
MGTLFLVSTPIGNLEDITRRAERVLGEVDRVLAEDTRRTGMLLKHLGIRRPLVSVHEHNEASRVDSVLGWLEAGEDLALVSDAGTPLLSDPGGRLVPAVVEAGHRVEPVPGPSAVLAALVGSGLPADRFTFLGFAPRKGPERADFVRTLLDAEDTTILYESPERLTALLETLCAEGQEDRPVCVARELTKVHETFRRGTLGEALAYYRENPPLGEVTVVVGAAPSRAGGGDVDRQAVQALARSLLEQGESPSRAAREVSKRLGVAKNMAYEVIQGMTQGETA